MNSATNIRMDNDNAIIIQINQVLSKPHVDVSLMPTFKVRYNGTRIDTAPM